MTGRAGAAMGAADGQSLAALVEHGGVHREVGGESMKEVVSAIIGLLPPVPALDREKLRREILEREALISTGVGRGIALPHPRSPMLAGGSAEAPMVAIAFPAQPVDWNTQDGSKVRTVFLIISSSVRQHLGTLSKINFLCQQEKFYALIERRAPREEIIAAIGEAEAAWAQRHGGNLQAL